MDQALTVTQYRTKCSSSFRELQGAHLGVLSPSWTFPNTNGTSGVKGPTRTSPEGRENFSVKHFWVPTFLQLCILSTSWWASRQVMHNILNSMFIHNSWRFLLSVWPPIIFKHFNGLRALLIVKLSCLFGESDLAEEFLVVAAIIVCRFDSGKGTLRCLMSDRLLSHILSQVNFQWGIYHDIALLVVRNQIFLRRCWLNLVFLYSLINTDLLIVDDHCLLLALLLSWSMVWIRLLILILITISIIVTTLLLVCRTRAFVAVLHFNFELLGATQLALIFNSVELVFMMTIWNRGSQIRCRIRSGALRLIFGRLKLFVFSLITGCRWWRFFYYVCDFIGFNRSEALFDRLLSSVYCFCIPIGLAPFYQRWLIMALFQVFDVIVVYSALEKWLWAHFFYWYQRVGVWHQVFRSCLWRIWLTVVIEFPFRASSHLSGIHSNSLFFRLDQICDMLHTLYPMAHVLILTWLVT